jgi:hypothetical protein
MIGNLYYKKPLDTIEIKFIQVTLVVVKEDGIWKVSFEMEDEKQAENKINDTET